METKWLIQHPKSKAKRHTMANSKPRNNQRADRGANKKAGNAPKLSPEQERTKLAKELRLKPRTKAYIDLLNTEKSISQTEAYIRTHDTDNRLTARKEASKLLTKRNVQLYKDSAISKAKETIVSLMSSDNESIKLKAATDVLDRTQGKAIQKTENTNNTVEVKLDLTGLRIGSHHIEPVDLPLITE